MPVMYNSPVGGPHPVHEARARARAGGCGHTGNSLTVWFDDPEQEHICDEIDDDVVLMKDAAGRVIGFERLNYLSKQQQMDQESVPVEVQLI